ncbi:MAG: histidine triad nucleotide-binding protein [Francisellaceae bacterium]
MSDCIFCKIVSGEIPADKLYEDEHFVVFHDIAPAAEIHVLVIPKKHITSFFDLAPEDHDLMGQLTLSIPKIAGMLGLEEGFKTLINTGHGGGQKVFHLHYHILGGRQLKRTIG